ncbi:MAG: VOC family protein [Calditrichaeota bacterium]|nr:VOC family protein [Calditrichota bacterium]
MVSLAKIEAIVFNVKNMQRSFQFYKDTLDLDFKIINSHDGQFAVASLNGLALVLVENAEPAGRSPVVVFGIEEGIENIVDGLIKYGSEIVLPISAAPDGGLTADFKDPDGHILSVHQPAKARRRV